MLAPGVRLASGRMPDHRVVAQGEGFVDAALDLFLREVFQHEAISRRKDLRRMGG